ncbi:hypothetical protein OCU04_005958 [Sclerotinia nivalis]|uniref:NADH-ubiquinone oxidoreductase B15 subunit n=1 Tax=Sclerotinia nivalis TaxID=352851 RepID=A0A9X0AM86_9HELO|nr:hypothetical protein OCU04_005958 [Sclerotinia nivalis]
MVTTIDLAVWEILMGIDMFTNRHKYFRWTGRTAAITFVFGAFIPSIVGYLAYTTDGKWEMRGKRRGDVIAEF